MNTRQHRCIIELAHRLGPVLDHAHLALHGFRPRQDYDWVSAIDSSIAVVATDDFMAGNLRRLPFDNTHAKIINGIEHLHAFARHLGSLGQVGSIFAPLSLLRISMEAFAYLEWLNDPNISEAVLFSRHLAESECAARRDAAIGRILAEEFSDSETTNANRAAKQLADDCERLVATWNTEILLDDQTQCKDAKRESNTSTVQKVIDKSNPEFGRMSELPYKQLSGVVHADPFSMLNLLHTQDPQPSTQFSTSTLSIDALMPNTYCALQVMNTSLASVSMRWEYEHPENGLEEVLDIAVCCYDTHRGQLVLT